MNQFEVQHNTLKVFRQFFEKNGFLEIMSPPIVEHPGMEPHIHPFEVFSAHQKKTTQKYLHSSPEFFMKEKLSQGLKEIYTIGYSFRDEPNSDFHRSQFLMVEWYRTDVYYDKIKEDCISLIKNFSKEFSLKEKTVYHKTLKQLMNETLQVNVEEFLNINDLKNLIKNDYKNIIVNENIDSWNDLFFLLFLNEVEPKLQDFPVLFLDQYPKSMAALSTINSKNSNFCDRFELYINGVEIANCFHEETSLEVLQSNQKIWEKEKTQCYQYNLPYPEKFFQTMKKGFPKTSGIALGLERFMYTLLEEKIKFSSDF